MGNSNSRRNSKKKQQRKSSYLKDNSKFSDNEDLILKSHSIINGYGVPSSSTTNLLATKSNGGQSVLIRQKSTRKSEIANHPISANGREIIQFCFENSHHDIGVRICGRLYEKRPDYQQFVHQLGKVKFGQMTHGLSEFLDKSFGFKPDFWVSLADAITVEAVILDQATHLPTDTVTAWSLFVSILFSSIRDGYYTALREQRKTFRKQSFRQNSNVEQLNPIQQQTQQHLSPSITTIPLIADVSPTRKDSNTSVNQKKLSVGSADGRTASSRRPSTTTATFLEV